jgi:hypothetical protein
MALVVASAMPLYAQDAALERQVADLRDLVVKLQARVDQLERREAAASRPVETPPPPIAAGAQPSPSPATPPSAPLPPNLLAGTTFSAAIDGYYAYNFNSPVGRVNLLRAYDVSSNAFSLNQANIIVENAPDPDKGKRWGARLDLQFGQATETLQGNAANEALPDVYRNIFQAYGTYVFPLGEGLTVDFGKFASSLGLEGNYTKDQINYSRSFFFDFLPFYHQGVRASYKINNVVTANFWAVNGTDQSEPFNGFKDQFYGTTLTPNKNFTWNINYYLGQEHPDVVYYLNGSAPVGAPNQQGIPFEPIAHPPTGKYHVFDTYATWNASSKLTLAGELDYVIQRDLTTSAPQRADGGAGYLRYQLTPKLALGLRAEYLTDHGGLYSGTSQVLKEGTVTLEYKLAEGFLFRNEWRGDFSSAKFFYTDTLGVLSKRQNTATMGLVWWFGSKPGAW